jgi:DNA methylase
LDEPAILVFDRQQGKPMTTELKCINSHITNSFAAYNGDTFELMPSLVADSIGYTIYSPPFVSMYRFSASERDMGNCGTDEEFMEHYAYLIRENLRATKPGRLVSVHCMNLPSTIAHEGYIGVRDYRGAIIREHLGNEQQEFIVAIRRLKMRAKLAGLDGDIARVSNLVDVIERMEEELRSHPGDKGFIYHSEVCIWKDPVVAMQRTKAIGLLHKQICKDSSMSRQGLADYVCTFRKPGKNPDPIAGRLDCFVGENFESTGDLSIDIWQRYASPVWMDIRQGRTLNGREARSDKDEAHISPLQLDVIERCMQLWSNPGDVVLSPFMGIGSEGVVSLQMGRKFVGFELKPEYFQVAVKNLKAEEKKATQPSLFDTVEEEHSQEVTS